jgi:hypothetical protein
MVDSEGVSVVGGLCVCVFQQVFVSVRKNVKRGAVTTTSRGKRGQKKVTKKKRVVECSSQSDCSQTDS